MVCEMGKLMREKRNRFDYKGKERNDFSKMGSLLRLNVPPWVEMPERDMYYLTPKSYILSENRETARQTRPSSQSTESKSTSSVP